VKTKSYKPNKVNIVTLGCSKNIVDSEVLMGQLRANNFDVEHEGEKEDAGIVIVNTCGFIDKAKQESIDTILAYANEKTEGNIEKLYVTGCLSARYKEDLALEIPEVDAWFGTLELPQLLKRLNADYKHELIGERMLTTPQHFAYLKISEGCNRTCSFCAIPLMRGVHVSRTIESLVTEAKHLASIGVKELILIAQELTYYGLDVYKKRALPELLEALNEVEGIEWIRLHYAYPSKFPLEILDAMVRLPKVCKYLDIPLQHINDKVLDDMRRQITRAETEELLNTIRTKVPGIAIRTTMLVGFPGETEAQFQELVEFIQTFKFDRLGVFTYSHEDNTRAFDLKDNVSKKVKQERANRLMEAQRSISEEINKAKIDKTFKVLFDRVENEYFVGRTEFDSNEVDNEVLVPTNEHYVRLGDFADVLITDCTEYDLFGTVVLPK
jgi:ribosomal protein S12 methylthiotransferase